MRHEGRGSDVEDENFIDNDISNDNSISRSMAALSLATSPVKVMVRRLPRGEVLLEEHSPNPKYTVLSIVWEASAIACYYGVSH